MPRLTSLDMLEKMTPAELLPLINQALQEFTHGRASMHIPPEASDVDILLAEFRRRMEVESRSVERVNGI